MQYARLNTRITLQAPSTTADGYGETGATWTDIADVWASLEPIQGREFFSAQQVNAETTHRIRIRYRTGVTAAMRFKYGARFFEIQSVINTSERNNELVLMCTERNPES
jgi:SPP1 family predicted phage head-tail adaptor